MNQAESCAPAATRTPLWRPRRRSQLKVGLCQKPALIAKPADSVCCFEHDAAATSELFDLTRMGHAPILPAPMSSNREGGDAAAFALDLRLLRHQRGANVRELECRRSSGSDAF
jgi:hypothetical protein